MNKPFFIKNRILESPRLYLRPWRKTDLEDFYAYAKIEGVGERAGWTHHKSLTESQTILDLFMDEDKTFALELKESGKVIGSLGVETYSEEDLPELSALQGRELGYVLGKDYWNQGLMTEAVACLQRELFEKEDLDFLVCEHFPGNDPSGKVMMKNGFSFYKTRKGVLRSGEEVELLVYLCNNPTK